jgi:hypothetical protein
VTQANGKQPAPAEPLEVSLDLDTYTNGELEELEDLTGVEVSALPSDRLPSQKVQNVLVWMTMRRANPQATLDDARALFGHQWRYAKPAGPLTASDAKTGRNASPQSAPSTA